MPSNNHDYAPAVQDIKTPSSEIDFSGQYYDIKILYQSILVFLKAFVRLVQENEERVTADP